MTGMPVDKFPNGSGTQDSLLYFIFKICFVRRYRQYHPIINELSFNGSNFNFNVPINRLVKKK